MTVLQHIVQYHVAALQAVLRINARVIVGSGLQHTYQYGCLVGCQIFRCSAEVGFAGCFDAKGVGTEVHRVGIHGKNLLLAEEHLNLCGGNPLLAFHDEHFYSWNIAEQTRRVLRAYTEHIFYQLLRDGGSTTGIVVYNIVFCCSRHTTEVNTEMVIETFIFR